jgi:hypothetical protein
MRVACLVAEASAPLPAAPAGSSFTAITVGKATAAEDVERAIGSGEFDAFVNMCAASRRSSDAAAADVAELLLEHRVAFAGVAPQMLKYDAGDHRMMAFYADIEVAGYRVATRHCAAAAARNLAFPVQLRHVTVDERLAAVEQAADDAALQPLLAAWLKQAPKVLVEELAAGEAAHVLVVAGADGEAPFVSQATAALQATATKLFKAMFGGVGHALYEFLVRADGTVRFVGVQPNCTLFAGTAAALLPATDVAAGAVLLAAVRPAAQPTFHVAFDAVMKGYYVVADRDMAKGDVVFRDENHTFPIVTKGHVDKFWSAEDQDTFKRYAWPLDNEGHVYAVWQDSPRTWRPINHSCDPNVIFAAGHSLNVIAARDIPAGESLTLDYATFCDFTMQPFDCFCKTAQCRKRIFIDEASLAKYGTHAWHRQLPPNLVQQK